ncbi:hypothetical protein GCK72_014269 [Caenorhabditis remanei]|nr:hypothetical protein GCK72_014269 [Caenorhabditis remanei]KAF1757812.1 hypothetical protein GCK72_014269 [Caenorhabditis remanei]
MNVSIDYRTRSSMNNIRRIHQFVYFTCPFNHIAFIVEKIMIIWDFDGGFNAKTTTFQVIQFIRLVTTFIGFMCLPAYAIERSFATYFHHDYEKENRSYIGYTMSFLIYLTSLIFVLICIHFSATFYPFLGLFLSNIISYIVNIINYKLNRYYYNCSLRKIYTYSLTERYQISENIQFAKFFHIFALTVALFATFCSFLLLMASLPFSSTEKNIFIVSFDLLYTIFILYCPYIHYKYNATWQHEFKKCVKLYNSEVKCSSITIGKPSLQLKTTFGERMNLGKNVQMDIYFSQLTNSWNTMRPNEP